MIASEASWNYGPYPRRWAFEQTLLSPQKDKDFEGWLESNGFTRTAFRLGVEHDRMSVEIFEGQGVEHYGRFFVVLNTAYQFHSVYVHDLPSLIAVLNELRPLVSASIQTAQEIDRLEKQSEESR
jgi:hypothetical protein